MKNDKKGHSLLAKSKWDDKRPEETQKTQKLSDSFGTFPSRWNVSFYQHRQHSSAQNSTILKGKTSDGRGRMALLPSGGKGRLWASGSCLHCWNREFLAVLFPVTLLPGKRYKNRHDLGHHSLSSKSNGGLYPDGQLVRQPRCSRCNAI